jgi:hypothetical protein
LIVLKVEAIGNLGHGQDALNVGGSRPKREAPIRAQMRLQQQMYPGAVDEAELTQVDDEAARPILGFMQGLLQNGSRSEIEFPSQQQNRGTAMW